MTNIKHPLVSVIIPTYNMGNTIGKSIESVNSQTYKNIELIIIDDGSTDNTYSQIMNIRQKNIHDDIKYYAQTNKGRSNAINKGLKISRGEYVALLDADDTLPEISIESRLNYLIANPNKKACFGVTYYMNNANKVYNLRWLREDVNAYSIKEQILNHPKIPFHAMSLMYDKSVFDYIGGFDESLKRANDIDMILKLISRYDIGKIDERVYDYVTTTHSIQTRLKNRITSAKEMNKIIKRYASADERNKLIMQRFFIDASKAVFEIFSSNK